MENAPEPDPADAGPVTDHLAILAEAERTLDDVDHALARLADGRYGTCEACGEPIADERLAVLPTARTCGAHPQLTDADTRSADASAEVGLLAP